MQVAPTWCCPWAVLHMPCLSWEKWKISPSLVELSAPGSGAGPAPSRPADLELPSHLQGQQLELVSTGHPQRVTSPLVRLGEPRGHDGRPQGQHSPSCCHPTASPVAGSHTAQPGHRPAAAGVLRGAAPRRALAAGANAMATPASALRTRAGSWCACASTTRPAPTASAASPSTRTGPGPAARPRLPMSVSVSIARAGSSWPQRWLAGPDVLCWCRTSSSGSSCPSCTCSILGGRDGLYSGAPLHSSAPSIPIPFTPRVQPSAPCMALHPPVLPRAEAPPKALAAGPSGSSDPTGGCRNLQCLPGAHPSSCLSPSLQLQRPLRGVFL